MTQIYPRVVDLSHHEIDDGSGYNFHAAKAYGIWGVIYKATEGVDYVDDTYDEAREQAKAVGLLWGAYHFFRPGNVAAQVEHFLHHACPGPETLLVLDHEDPDCSLDDVKLFLRLVEEKTGQRPALYSGHVLKEQIGSERDAYLADTRLWLAQYGSNLEWPPNWQDVWLWQYTDGVEGPGPHSIPGIGECDINSFDGTQEELTLSWAEAMPLPPKPIPPRPPMPDNIPPWLAVMRAITGMTEFEGSADNPRIMHMADAIAREYPAQAEYCSWYTGDDVAWCGLTVAYCVTLAGYEPQFGDTDTERWMWAQSWAEWGEPLAQPKQGCIVVQTRDGGGHVTLFERWEGGNLICRGGNQSDMVKESSYDPSVVIAYRWPRQSLVTVDGLDPHELQLVQAGLNVAIAPNPLLDVDGQYGPATEAAIREMQREFALPVNGLPTKDTVDTMLDACKSWNANRKVISMGR